MALRTACTRSSDQESAANRRELLIGTFSIDRGARYGRAVA